MYVVWGEWGCSQTCFSESGLKPSKKMDGGCVADVPVVSRSWQNSLSYRLDYHQDEGSRRGVQAGAGYCAWEAGAWQVSEQEGAPFTELRVL